MSDTDFNFGENRLTAEAFAWSLKKCKKTKNGWTACCPAHDDENPSLHIAEGDSGKILVCCQSNHCSLEAIAKATGRRVSDFMGGNGKLHKQKKLVRTTPYDIKDAEGNLVAIRLRDDFDDKTKRLQWKLPDGTWGLNGLSPTKLPLYCTQLLSGWDREAEIIIAEGEKAADALLCRGIKALGTFGTSVVPEDLSYLQGRPVVLWPDNDKGGAEHMTKVAAKLSGVASSVRTFKWGEREKDDAYDFFARGGTEEQLDQLLADARTPDAETLDGPKIWRLDELVHSSEIPKPETFFGETFAKGGLFLLAGRRGTGKTYFSLGLGAAIALCRPFGPLSCREGRVLYLSQEMGERGMKARLGTLFPDPEELAAISDHMRMIVKAPFRLDSDEGLEPLKRLLDIVKPDALITDALRDVKGQARENDNDEMAEVMVRARDQIAEEYELACMILHHKGKLGSDGVDRGARGASTIEDVPEDVLYLSPGKATFDKNREGDLAGKSFSFAISENAEGRKLLELGKTLGWSEEAAKVGVEKGAKIQGYVRHKGTLVSTKELIAFIMREYPANGEGQARADVEEACSQGFIVREKKGWYRTP